MSPEMWCALSIARYADETWVDDRMKNGLSSGEGLINEVRDERKAANPKTKEIEIIDLGATDKRLMVTEAEFGNALAVMAQATTFRP
jgi:hypothetical protein